MIRKWLMMSLALATYLSSFALPDIQCVADGMSGEYCGVGYGITVNVSTPTSGYTVKYAESADGPWVDELKYVNVCTDKPIYYQVTAEGYTTATGSANVTVTPKELTEDIIWLVFPSEDYVYDGTAKKPEVAAFDGEPSIITDDDWEVSFTDNVNAGTATATFTGKGNYTGTCTEEFEIAKADNAWTTEPAVADWTYGETPSAPVSAAKAGTATVTYSSGATPPTLPGDYTATFTVPESDNYNALTKTVSFKVLPAEIKCVADGSSGEYCGTGYGISVSVSTPSSGYEVKYAESAEGPWLDEVKYVNVCTARPVFYRVTATGYETKVGSANVTVTPKTLTNDHIWLVLPADDYVYDGSPKTPEAAFGDGDPSILTEADFTVSYAGNVNAGTATATFTGRGNYKGLCTEEFPILKAENAWTTEPAVAGWTYGEAPSAPVSAAKAGTATVTYSSGATPPTLPGDYTATFTVPESDNYNALTKTVGFKVLPAEIKCVADGSSGEYCGVGYGITVNVSTPASGYTVKYAESADGPWVDELKYVNVCADKPIYYQVTAEGYTTATGSANVTVTPKELTEDIIWLVFPSEDYVYDGTAKEPEVAAFDGEPSIITDDDWEVSFTDNVNAGTATATFTGKGNYTGTCTEAFVIKGKPFVAGGDEPGSGGVVEGGVSKFDLTVMYDGTGHHLDQAAISAAFAEVSSGEDVTIAYKAGLADEWGAVSPDFTNVCTRSVWYRVRAPNFEDYVHEAKIAVTNRPVTLVSGTSSWESDGQAHSNATVTVEGVGFVAGEGVACRDFTLITDVGEKENAFAYELVLNVGSIPANYLVTCRNGTLTVTKPKSALLTGEISWTFLKATGTYFAQVKVTCTNGVEAGVSDLKFMFADRRDSAGNVAAQLWSTPRRSPVSACETFAGETYRAIPLDASLIMEENLPVAFGVSSPSASTIPVEERMIELYVRRRVSPVTGNETTGDVENFVGYLSWKTGDETFMVPLVAGGAVAGRLQSVPLLEHVPLSVAQLNTALAVGVVAGNGCLATCRLTAFTLEGDQIRGRLEVGADGRIGSLGANVLLTLLAAEKPSGPFLEAGCVRATETFTLSRPKGCSFFKVRLDVEPVVE